MDILTFEFAVRERPEADVMLVNLADRLDRRLTDLKRMRHFVITIRARRRFALRDGGRSRSTRRRRSARA